MRIILMATGEIAMPAFQRLLDDGMAPLALVTQPDRPVGRHQNAAAAPPLKAPAIAAGIPVLQPEHASDAAGAMDALRPDVVVVMAYGQILRAPVLALPRVAIINLHASLLPKYRGAACIQAAIDHGDAETGVTAIHVARKLDAGDIIHFRHVGIEGDETGGSLHEKLAALASGVLAESLAMLAAGNAPRMPQDEAAATHVGKLCRDDGRLDWGRPAADLERRIRAYDPWPGTFTTFRHHGRCKRLKIFPHSEVADSPGIAVGSVVADGDRLIVGCGCGALAIGDVQPEGGKRMSAGEFARGHHITVLGGE